MLKLYPLPQCETARHTTSWRPFPALIAYASVLGRRFGNSSISAVVRTPIRILPDMTALGRHFSLSLPMDSRSALPKSCPKSEAAMIAAAQRTTARAVHVRAVAFGQLVRASEIEMHDRYVENLRGPRWAASRRQRAFNSGPPKRGHVRWRCRDWIPAASRHGALCIARLNALM